MENIYNTVGCSNC